MIEVATDEASVEEASRPPLVEVEPEGDDVAADKEPKEKRAPVPRETKAMAELRNNTDNALKEWMEGLSPNGGVKVRVTRTSPKVWKGLNVGGSLATYDHYIDEDWIREHHGGGNFMLEVKKPRTNGSGWVIAGSRAIAIAGDPRTDDVFRDSPAGVPAVAPNTAGADMLVKAAFGSMERQLERAQAQPPQPQNHGTDVATMQLLLAPLQSQINQMGEMLREKDSQLAEMRRPPPVEVDPIKDKMFSALIDGDSARVVSMRAQHESELRTLRELSIASEARLRDAFDRDRQAINMAHEREMNTLRSSYDMKVASQDTMNGTIKSLLEGEIRRLESSLTEARTELVALRAKKDKTIIEQATEFAAIKEAIGDITGSDEKEKSTLEKVMEVAGNLPAVQGLIGKLGEAQAPAPPPPQPMARPRPQLMTGPDGNLYRQMPNGDMVMVRERKKVAAPAVPGQPVIPDIAPATIAAAVGFLESAYRGGQEASEVATSVRSMVPGDVLTAIRELGIDGFLTQVAKLDSTSPISTQGGRNWSRKLGKSLLEG
jgi:hypothetical protein